MKIIMYHYVRPDNSCYPYLNYLNLNIFQRQLDYFQNKYGFISKQDFINSIDSNEPLKGVVLSFDDGLKDHYKYVLPELKKRKLWGLFYICSGVYSSRKMLGVHRVQYLKGKYGSSVILKEALNMIEDHMLDESNIELFDKEIYIDSNYQESEKKLRRLFNYYISYDYRDKILDSLMKKYFNENKLFDEVYLNINELNEIHNEGNIIGSHAVTHKVLSRLSYTDQEQEIKKSFDFLKTTISLEPPYSFCYPYGYRASYNNDTLKILKTNKIHNAVIFDNKEQSDSIERLELSRLDCNKFMED